jgi:hypothetical protein
VTQNNIAMAYWGAGRLAEAVGELELVVAFYAAVEHPSLEASTAMLKRVRTELHQGVRAAMLTSEGAVRG